MDRLEAIKALRSNAGFYANLTVHKKATEQVVWLISEIEQLRKEKEWLIESYATTVYLTTDGKTIQERIDDIKEAMQQALKEVEDNVGRNIN